MKHFYFLPLLALYLTIVLVAAPPELVGDEAGYLMHARYLSQGFYSKTDPDQIKLWWGPGYPLVLLPFVLLKLPLLAARLLNALFLWAALLFLHQSLKRFVSPKPALVISIIVGLYPPFLRYLPLLYTECLTVFLISAFVFQFSALCQARNSSAKHLLLCAVILAGLALTKVFFAYVILTMLLISALLLIWRRRIILRVLPVFAAALFLCLPYLLYTYSLTGKIFYWGNSGGLSLYWMATPFEKELGDWFWQQNFKDHPELSKNHKAFFDELQKIPIVDRDNAFKKRAIENIVQHPKKYLKNWTANIGRLLFNYPYSYTSQKLRTYLYIIPNMFLVVFAVLGIYPAWVGRKMIPPELYLLLLFGLVAFGGLSLLSAVSRYFAVLVPLFIPLLAFTWTKLVHIELPQTYSDCQN